MLENLIANGMDLATYMTKFQWDMAKYPIKQSLKNLSDMIAKQVKCKICAWVDGAIEAIAKVIRYVLFPIGSILLQSNSKFLQQKP